MKFKVGDVVICHNRMGGMIPDAGWKLGLVFKIASIGEGIAWRPKNNGGVFFENISLYNETPEKYNEACHKFDKKLWKRYQ